MLKRRWSEGSSSLESSRPILPTLSYVLNTLKHVKVILKQIPDERHELIEFMCNWQNVIWDLERDWSLRISSARLDVGRLLQDVLDGFEEIFSDSVLEWAHVQKPSGHGFPRLAAICKFVEDSADLSVLDPEALKPGVAVYQKASRERFCERVNSWRSRLTKIEDQANADYRVEYAPRKQLNQATLRTWNLIESANRIFRRTECKTHQNHSICIFLGTYSGRDKTIDHCYIDLLLSSNHDLNPCEEVRIHSLDLRYDEDFEGLQQRFDWLLDEPRTIDPFCSVLDESFTDFQHNWICEADETFSDHDPSNAKLSQGSPRQLISFAELLASRVPKSGAIGSTSGTNPTKLVLAIILSYTLLHVCTSTELKERWPYNHIYFLRVAQNIVLRPLLCIDLNLNSLTTESLSPNAHEYPALIGFATMLLEIHQCQSLQSMLQVTSGSRHQQQDIKRLETAFKSRQAKSKIGSPAFQAVIRFCINPTFQPLTPGDQADLPIQIYENIIRPFEEELRGFDPRLLENIDEQALITDLETGQELADVHNMVRTPRSPFSPPPHKSRSQSPHTRHGQTLSDHLTHPISRTQRKRNKLSLNEAPSTNIVSATQEPVSKSVTSENLTSQGSPNMSREWFRMFESVLEQLYSAHDSSSRANVVRIAILDTGIDRSDNIVRRFKDRIVRVCNFLDDRSGVDENDHSGDQSGHGTHIACTILKWARYAEVSIARIAKEADHLDKGNARSIVKALKLARQVWEVDLIVMPFGFSDLEDDIDDELTKAIKDDILVFVAAHNDGPNRPQSWPASKDQVFGVHSVNGNGQWSDFNPRPRKNNYNFAIIGEHISSVWPSSVSKSSREKKTGNSYATSVAVALVASVLHWSMLRPDLQRTKTKMKTYEGMRDVLDLMVNSEEAEDKRYIAIYPKHLFNGNLAHSEAKIIERLRGLRN